MLENKTILHKYVKIDNSINTKNKFIEEYGKDCVTVFERNNNESIIKVILPNIKKSFFNIKRNTILGAYGLENIETQRIIYQDNETGYINVIFYQYNEDILTQKQMDEALGDKDIDKDILSPIGAYSYAKYDTINIEGLKDANIIVNGEYLLIQTLEGNVYMYKMKYNLPVEFHGQFQLENNIKILSFKLPTDLINNSKICILPYEEYNLKSHENVIIEFNDTYLIFTRNANNLEEYVRDEEQFFSANTSLNLGIADDLLENGKRMPIIFEDSDNEDSLVLLNQLDNTIKYKTTDLIGFEKKIKGIDFMADSYNRTIVFVGNKYIVLEVSNEENIFLEIYKIEFNECNFLYSTYDNFNKKDKSLKELFYINEEAGLFSFYYIQNYIIEYNFVFLELKRKVNNIYKTLDLLYLGSNYFFDKRKKVLIFLNQNTFDIEIIKIKDFTFDKYYSYFIGKERGIEMKFLKNIYE